MDRLEQLKLKYQSVLNLVEKKGMWLSHVHLEGDKLFMEGAVPSQEAKNDIWNQIKLVDASFADLTCDLSVDTSLTPPAAAPKTYTGVAGDSLWKIAEKHWGKSSLYPRIIAANLGKVKDEKTVIHPGDGLVIVEAQ